MHLLLTLNQCPAWPALAANCELPLIDDIALASKEQGCFLNNDQLPTALPSLLAQLPPSSKLWLGVLTAEQFLAHGVAQGMTLVKAAAHWQESIQQLLDIQRQQRQRVQLFNLEHALAQPHSLRAKLELSPIKQGASLASTYTPLILLAANQYLAQNIELQNLNNRLQATTTPLYEVKSPVLDIDEFLQQYQQQQTQLAQLGTQTQKANNLEQQLASAQAASETRQKQIAELHQQEQTQIAQLSVQTQKANNLEQQLASAQAASETLQKQIAELRNELAQTKNTAEERDLILAQLHKVQEELERYYLQLQEKAQAHNSTITALQERDAQLNALAQEREVLRNQIQQHEQHSQHLEHLVHLAHQENIQAQQEYKHTLLARDKQHAREATKLEAELRKTKARAASAEYAGSLLQQELEDIKRSRVWKGTNPIRSFSRLLRKGNLQQQQLIQEVALILTSEYFDVEWYLTHYTDVRESGINPAEHYLLYGAHEGRLPGPLFDGNWYKEHYPDVTEADINPLLHFIKFGQQEGRSSSPMLLTNDQHSES